MPHAVDDVDGKKQPGQILKQHDLRVWRGVGAAELFAEYDDDVCQHYGAIDDAGDANPLFASDVGVEGEEIERAEEEGIDPDGGLPPRGPGDDERVECTPIPVDKIDKGVWRPDGIGEVGGVGDNNLLEIDDVGDEENVDQEECDNGDVPTSLRKRDGLSVHVCSPVFSVGRCAGRSRWLRPAHLPTVSGGIPFFVCMIIPDSGMYCRTLEMVQSRKAL